MESGAGPSSEVGGMLVKASVTDAFRSDFAQALYNGTGLSAVTRVVLVDIYGTERDSATDLTFEVSGGALYIRASITASASYTCRYVRVYAGAKRYMDAQLPTDAQVASGTTYSVTVLYTYTPSGSMSNYTFVDVNLRSTLYDVLRGAKSASALNITKARIYVTNIDVFPPTTTYYDLTLSKSVSGTRVTWSGSLTLDYNAEVEDIEVYAGVFILYKWSVSTPVGVSAGSTVSYSETFNT